MTNNRIVAATFLSWLLFFPAITWLPLLPVLDVINAMGLTFGLVVLWRYLPAGIWALWRACYGEPITRGPMLVLGILQTWLAMVGRTMFIWHWRFLGEPDRGLDSVGMSICAWFILGGGACHLSASAMKSDDVQVPALSAKLIWSSLVSGLILGVCVAYGRWRTNGEVDHASLLVRMVADLLGAAGA